MKVRCIAYDDESWFMIVNGIKKYIKGPKYEEICTVVGMPSPSGYDFAEWPSPDAEGWDKTHFVPVIDNSIEEMINAALEVEEEELCY